MRKLYPSYLSVGQRINWHYRQFLLAERSLIEDFWFPPHLDHVLLPCTTRCRSPTDCPMDTGLDISEQHFTRNYEHYYRLRSRGIIRHTCLTVYSLIPCPIAIKIYSCRLNSEANAIYLSIFSRGVQHPLTL